MTEQWRDIPGYEGRYQVSDQGRVKSLYRGKERILRPGLQNSYPFVNFSVGNNSKLHRVHSLVMLAFVGPRPEGFQVDHINHIRTDNRLENLRYLHYSENLAQGGQTLTGKIIGEDNSRSKLTNRQRAEIRYLAQVGMQHQKIAAMYGISPTTISYVAKSEASKKVDLSESDMALALNTALGSVMFTEAQLRTLILAVSEGSFRASIVGESPRISTARSLERLGLLANIKGSLSCFEPTNEGCHQIAILNAVVAVAAAFKALDGNGSAQSQSAALAAVAALVKGGSDVV